MTGLSDLAVRKDSQPVREQRSSAEPRSTRRIAEWTLREWRYLSRRTALPFSAWKGGDYRWQGIPAATGI